MNEKLFVGVDVSKSHLDVHIHPISKKIRVENSELGIALLVKRLSSFGTNVSQIVCEASGGYEVFMKNILHAAGYNVWSVNPRRVKAFIESEGVLVKTDPSDARMIAMFAAKKQCSYQPYVSTPVDQELCGAIKRRFDLIEMVKGEKMRLQSPLYKNEKKGIKAIIKFLEKQIQKYDDKIDKLIQENKVWKRKTQIIESIPGVGRITSIVLLSSMPELGTISHKKAAALLGVAPYTKESGVYKGVSKIRGGRPEARRVVYMAALSASRSNPVFIKFYKKLKKSGKKSKVALVAVMRKLIVMINAMIEKDKEWNQELHNVVA